MSAPDKNRTTSRLMAGLLVVGCLAFSLSPRDSWAQTPATQTQQAQPSQTHPPQDADLPEAPMVQPSATPPEPPPIPKPEEKKPSTADRNPWTNQPNTKPADTGSSTAAPGDQPATPPPMPPVRTVPPGTSKNASGAQEQLYTYVVHANFVQLPVTVKDRDGRRVEGLLPTDFTVKENGTVQKLSFFTQDPFGLSVAIVLDLGMPDAAVQKVNQTFSALVGAFAPYDEVALYIYSGTVSEVSDFTAVTQKLTSLLNGMKTERGRNNGVPVMSGPMAPNGPIINGIPVGSPTQPVYTPPKEAHVLNDAILRAALDLSNRARTRRKIIFVISDGRELGSQAGYRDVLRLLETRDIQVRAVVVDSGALPGFRQVGKIHLPGQGFNNILPRYVSATCGES